MLGRWPSLSARLSSSSGLRTRWVTVTVGLTLLWMRPAQGAGPLTRPRRPRLAVVLWLLLDSLELWCYTECSSLCFCILVVLLLLALRLMLWSEEETPHRPCHPVGGFLASGALGGLWGKGPQWALPLLVHLAGGLMSRPAASGPVGAWPWHQIAGQIPRRSGRIFAPQPPAKRAQAPLAGP